MHPIDAPNFRCLPVRVNGIPIRLEILALAADIARSRLHEKPPVFMVVARVSESAKMFMWVQSLSNSREVTPATRRQPGRGSSRS